VGEKMKIVLQLGQNWPILLNISTTTEPVITNVSVFVDVYMRIIKLT